VPIGLRLARRWPLATDGLRDQLPVRESVRLPLACADVAAPVGLPGAAIVCPVADIAGVCASPGIDDPEVVAAGHSRTR